MFTVVRVMFRVVKQDLGVNVLHIESRPSRLRESEFEILVDVECDNKRMEQLTGMLKREVAAINLATFESGAEVPPPTPMSATASFGTSHNNILLLLRNVHRFKHLIWANKRNIGRVGEYPLEVLTSGCIFLLFFKLHLNSNVELLAF